MTLSVLIPSLGRKKELLDTLEALQKQTLRADEIILVDQNFPPFPEVVEFCEKHPEIHHFQTPVPGVSLNYNHALRLAQCEVVLFLDDDIVPDPRLLEMHLRHYSSGGTLGGVAGRVTQPSGDPAPETLTQVGQYHRWKGTISAYFNALHETDVQIAPGGNMSFLRKVLIEAGGFDLGFEGNGYFFETDASLRVSQSGYRIAFEPKAYVKHLMAPSGGARITDKAQHTYYYIKNGIRLYRRHSPLVVLPWLLTRSLAYVFAKAAYNRDFRILIQGLRAMRDGLTQNMEIAQ